MGDCGKIMAGLDVDDFALVDLVDLVAVVVVVGGGEVESVIVIVVVVDVVDVVVGLSLVDPPINTNR